MVDKGSRREALKGSSRYYSACCKATVNALAAFRIHDVCNSVNNRCDLGKIFVQCFNCGMDAARAGHRMCHDIPAVVIVSDGVYLRPGNTVE